MDLVGAWLRQLMRAGTAAAIVPVALLAALIVIVLGSGGLGGLGSLGQVVSGPAVSDVDGARSPSATEDLRAAPVAPGGSDAAVRRTTAPSSPGTSGRAPAPGSGRPRPQQQPSETAIAPRPGSPSVTGPPAQLTPPAPVAPPPPPPPPAAGQARPQLGEVLGATVDGVVGGLQTLIDQLGQALGGKPPRAR